MGPLSIFHSEKEIPSQIVLLYFCANPHNLMASKTEITTSTAAHQQGSIKIPGQPLNAVFWFDYFMRL